MSAARQGSRVLPGLEGGGVNRAEFRASVLFSYEAPVHVVREVLAYSERAFPSGSATMRLRAPRSDELHVAAWEQYAEAAQQEGAFAALKRRLVQLNFPIQTGISQSAGYRAATQHGQPVGTIPEATGLVLRDPDALELFIHPSLAGPVPVLVAANRDDFLALLHALTARNEPVDVPHSMGAVTVAGYNNWDRIRALREQWEANAPSDPSEAGWQRELRWSIEPYKQLYQDTFILLSRGPYSNVPAHALGLDEGTWETMSLAIRLEHECTHHATRRLFGAMRNHLLDELIADYRAIVAATGAYRAEWFLHFMGLEAYPDYREGGRLQNYRGQPPLSSDAFQLLQVLVRDAAHHLEAFDQGQGARFREPLAQIRLLAALTCLSLEELAGWDVDHLVQYAPLLFADSSLEVTP